MDPLTIIVILVIVEVATGGVSGTVGAATGAVADGVKAAAKETAKGANDWYAKRAKVLAKTRRGRARLAAEKHAAGVVAFVGRGVAAGARAAGPGARSGWRRGRQVRRDAIANGARLARQGGATVTAKVADLKARRGGDGAPDGGAHKPPVGAADTAPRSPLGGYVRDESPGGADEQVPCPDCGGKGGACERCGGDGTVPAWTQDPRHGVIHDPEGRRFDGLDDDELRARAAKGDQDAARMLMCRAAARREVTDDDGDDMSEMQGWTPEEQREARQAAKDGKCCWVMNDGAMGPHELCGAPIRRGYIFCVRHLGELHEQGDRPDRFRFDELGLEAPEELNDDGFFNAGEYEQWLRENFDENGDPINQQSPTTGGGETDSSKGDDVAEAVAEDLGAKPYVDGWDGEADGFEAAIAFWEGKRDRLRASAEANSRHEVAGVSDVFGLYDAVIDAAQAAWEASRVHAQKLHDAHDAALEATAGSNVESQQDYAGAR